MPSVTISDDISSTATKKPFSAPIKMPARSAATSAIPLPVMGAIGAFALECVLIGSSNYFTAGPKRSTRSFHEAMILAFVFRAL